MTARLGVLVLPEHADPDGLRVWQRVERLGVHHAWTYDHLSWRTCDGRPWFDAMTTLAAAACTTDRIRLGTLVASANFRHPVATALAAMTVDHLSRGRFILGVGAGAAGPDATVLGAAPLSPAQKADRLTEFVTVADRLLRVKRADFRGRYFSAVDARLVPGCVQQPRVPLAVAAAGARGMRLAAEHGEFWVTIGRTREPGAQPEADAFRTLHAQVGRLTEACERIGRDPGDLRRLVNLSRIVADPYSSAQRLVDLVGRCAGLGFTDVVVAYPRAAGVFAGNLSAFEEAVTAYLRGG